LESITGFTPGGALLVTPKGGLALHDSGQQRHSHNFESLDMHQVKV
jgi:hypothetical protein